MLPDWGSFIKEASFHGTSALLEQNSEPSTPAFRLFRGLKRYDGMGTYEAAFTLSLVGTSSPLLPRPSLLHLCCYSPFAMALGFASSELVALCIESVLYGNPSPFHLNLDIRASLLPRDVPLCFRF